MLNINVTQILTSICDINNQILNYPVLSNHLQLTSLRNVSKLLIMSYLGPTVQEQLCPPAVTLVQKPLLDYVLEFLLAPVVP